MEKDNNKRSIIVNAMLFINLACAIIYFILLFFAKADKTFSLFLAMFFLLLFNSFTLFLNKYVMNESDKISLYCKSFIVVVITFVAILESIIQMNFPKSVFKEFLNTILVSIMPFVSVTLFLDVYIQVLKIIKFRTKIISTKDVLIKNAYITDTEVTNIVETIDPCYDYLSKKGEKALDPVMANRVKDIYISLNYNSLNKESVVNRMKKKLDFLTSKNIHIQFDASINYGEQTFDNNKNAEFQVVNIDLFIKYLQSINSQGKYSINEENALDIIDSYVNELVKLKINKFMFQELLVSQIEYILNHTNDLKLITPELFSEIGLKKQGTWLAWVGNPPMS